MKRTSFELGGNAPFIVFEDGEISSLCNVRLVFVYWCSFKERNELNYALTCTSDCLSGSSTIN